MKLAEQVTFGAGLLDRDAIKRAGMKTFLNDKPQTRVLALWQGKPLITLTTGNSPALAYLPASSTVFSKNAARMIYLGEDGVGPLCACDVSDWEPEGELPDPSVFLDQTHQHLEGTPENTFFAELREIMAGLTPADAEIAATARGVIEWHRIHRFCANCGEKSQPILGGWQRECTSCNHMHFPRTDPVVIMLITQGNSVLLGRSPQWPEGMYSLLAGFMEPGETIEAATRREVFEETGIRVGDVDYLASQPWPFPSSLMIGTRGLATSTEITIDPTEIEEALWVTREEMLDVFAERNSLIKPARKGSIAHFLLTNWLADRLD